jgi:uncharacterized protein YcaQ
VLRRPKTFQRVYDLPERIVDASHRPCGLVSSKSATIIRFREGDVITARVDLKADRKESNADQARTAESLARELRSLASWRNLETVEIRKANAFEKSLANFLAVKS